MYIQVKYKIIKYKDVYTHEMIIRWNVPLLHMQYIHFI